MHGFRSNCLKRFRVNENFNHTKHMSKATRLQKETALVNKTLAETFKRT